VLCSRIQNDFNCVGRGTVLCHFFARFAWGYLIGAGKEHQNRRGALPGLKPLTIGIVDDGSGEAQSVWAVFGQSSEDGTASIRPANGTDACGIDEWLRLEPRGRRYYVFAGVTATDPAADAAF
jgi:hypothetical protein